MSYYSQQEVAHSWAEDVLLGSIAAHWMVEKLLECFDVELPLILWEQPALTQPSAAVTVQNPRTERLTVAFATRGCSLLVLCHELAHVIRPWGEPFHDEIDWMLTALLLELARYEV